MVNGHHTQVHADFKNGSGSEFKPVTCQLVTRFREQNCLYLCAKQHFLDTRVKRRMELWIDHHLVLAPMVGEGCQSDQAHLNLFWGFVQTRWPCFILPLLRQLTDWIYGCKVGMLFRPSQNQLMDTSILVALSINSLYPPEMNWIPLIHSSPSKSPFFWVCVFNK